MKLVPYVNKILMPDKESDMLSLFFLCYPLSVEKIKS